MLLQEFWNGRFWPHCTRNLRESTRVGYESAWRLHVMPCFGGMGMDAISVELVDKWLANFDTAGAARKAWAVLRAILRRAIRWNLLDVDITRRDIQLPAKPHYEPREGGRLIGVLTPPQVARQYKGWCKRYSLPHVPARNLRHSWATNTLAAGADIAIVSKMLGHSDIKTTARYYLKPDIAALRDAQRLWERALIA